MKSIIIPVQCSHIMSSFNPGRRKFDLKEIEILSHFKIDINHSRIGSMFYNFKSKNWHSNTVRERYASLSLRVGQTLSTMHCLRKDSHICYYK